MVSKFAIIAVAFCAIGVIPSSFAQDGTVAVIGIGMGTATSVNYSGKVTSNDGSKLVFATATAGASSMGSQTVTLTDNTKVTIAGKAAKPADITVGAQVTVSCDGKDVANSVTVE